MADAGINVKIGADDAELKRKLEESAAAAKAFQDKMISHLESVQKVVMALAGVNGLGLINEALTGFGGAESAAQKFAQTLINACKEGMDKLDQLRGAARALGRDLGSAEAGTELVDRIIGISGHRGAESANLAAAGKLTAAGYTDKEEVFNIVKRLQDLAARFKVPIEDLAEIFAQAKVENWEPLKRLIKERADVAAEVEKLIPGGLQASPEKDWTEESAKVKEIASIEKEIVAAQKEREDLLKEMNKGKGPLETYNESVREQEAGLAQRELQRKAPSALEAQADATHRATLEQQIKADQDTLNELTAKRAKTPAEAARIQDEIAARQLSQQRVRDELAKMPSEAAEKAESYADEQLRAQIEAGRKRAEAEQKAFDAANKSADQKQKLSEIDAKLHELGNKRLIAEGERVTAERRAENEPRAAVAKAIEAAPAETGRQVLDKMLELTEKGNTAYGAAEANANKLAGALADLNKEFDALKIALAESLGEPVRKALRDAVDGFRQNLPGATEEVKRFGEQLGAAITQIETYLKGLFPELKKPSERSAEDAAAIASRGVALRGAEALYKATPFADLFGAFGLGPKGYAGDIGGALGNLVKAPIEWSKYFAGYGEAAQKLNNAADKIDQAADAQRQANNPQQ